MASEDTNIILHTLSAAAPVDVFMMMGVVTKLCAFVALLCGGLALVLAVVRLVSGGRRSGALAVTGLVGLVFAILGAAYTGVTSFIGYQNVHATHLFVVLPSVIEATYVLILGLVVWLIARIGNAGARKAG